MSNEKTHFGLPFPTEQLALAELHKQRVESVHVAERVETALIETGWVTEDECTDVANGVLTLDPMPKEEPEVKP
jgi:hypothetical protein